MEHESDCNCEEPCEDCNCNEEVNEEPNYLEMLQRLQAEFENYKKRNALLALKAKEEGLVKAIETATSISNAIFISSRNSAACLMIGRSLSDPMMMPTCGDVFMS